MALYLKEREEEEREEKYLNQSVPVNNVLYCNCAFQAKFFLPLHGESVEVNLTRGGSHEV